MEDMYYTATLPTTRRTMEGAMRRYKEVYESLSSFANVLGRTRSKILSSNAASYVNAEKIDRLYYTVDSLKSVMDFFEVGTEDMPNHQRSIALEKLANSINLQCREHITEAVGAVDPTVDVLAGVETKEPVNSEVKELLELLSQAREWSRAA